MYEKYFQVGNSYAHHAMKRAIYSSRTTNANLPRRQWLPSAPLPLAVLFLFLLPSSHSFVPALAPLRAALPVARAPMSPRTAGELGSTRGKVCARMLITSGTYQYGDFTCAFRKKEASKGREADPPLLLVHPVGIGLSSWFWDKFLEEWQGGEVFAADLIGCGQSTAWEPAKEGMFVPLDWVRALESLWAQNIQRPCVVVVQGGLAPVGVQLMARKTAEWDGSKDVCGLVLASPPSFDAMRKGLDSDEVATNWNWLSSKPGQLSYYVLRGRPFVKFFSNLFLFAGGSADEQWLQAACQGATEEAKWPVFAFNAGLVIAKGFDDEIQAISERGQPILVISGSEDGRTGKREASAASLASCELITLPGKNVVPWESPREAASAILEFCKNK